MNSCKLANKLFALLFETKKSKTAAFGLFGLLTACAGSFWLGEKNTAPNSYLSATLLNVADGDTLTVQISGEKCRVRLFGVDAPELKQAFGAESRDFLKKLLTKRLTLECQTKRDHYNRLVCDVYTANNLWVNESLVANGWAWHYATYSNNPNLAQAEQLARRAQKGLWQSNNPTPPWLWRKKNRH